MKNVIRVTILAALAATAGISTAMAQDQPPPDCLPCFSTPVLGDQAPSTLGVQLASTAHFAAVANDGVSAASFVDQPPPDCLPCVAASFIDQPPPDCLPCFVAPVLVDQPPPDCLPCIVN